MAVSIERSMNNDFHLGIIDHTIETAMGQDRGGQIEATSAVMRMNLISPPLGYTGPWPSTGEHLIPSYLHGLVRGY